MTTVIVFLGMVLFIYAAVMLFVFVFQSRLFFSPTYYRNDERFLELEEFLTPLLLPGADETLLEGILYEPPLPAKKIIFYFGGVQQDSVALAEKFAHYYPNIPFVSYNYRGYGKSGGKPSQKRLFEDAVHIYDDLVLRYAYKPDEIILMGYSLGTGVASFLASQRQVREVLLIAPYDSLYEVIKKRYPFSGIHWVLKQRFPSVDFVPHIDVPVHIYAASDDRVVNVKHAKMLKSHINNLAGFYEYGDVGHNDILFNRDVVEHIKKVLDTQ
jgi:hypothetical protein